jgi:hypothetical protein
MGRMGAALTCRENCHSQTPGDKHTLQAVLWGIFPAVAACAAASAARLWWLRRPLRTLRAAQARMEARRDPRGVYRFRDHPEVCRPGAWVGVEG